MDYQQIIEEKLTKELAEKLMKIEGECRGATIKTDWDFVFHEKGQKELETIEAKMAEVGYPLKYNEIKTMDFYPIGLDVISMLAIKEILNFSKEEVIKMGASAFKFSFFLKVFMRHFIFPRLFAKEVPKAWRKHYTIGELTLIRLDEKEKYGILRLENFNVHPLNCYILIGYFSKILKMVVGTPVTCQETKCFFRGDEFHEFLIKWK
jgi:hypothetical protein